MRLPVRRASLKTYQPIKCRLCAMHLKTKEIVGNFVYGGTSRQKFYRCPHCDIAFLFPAMSEKDEKIFYAKEFEKFMEKRSAKDFDWSGPEAHFQSNQKQYERRLRFFKDIVSPGKRVLEIGCSSGFMLAPLKEKGLDVVGIEPSGGFGSFLKRKGIEVYSSLDTFKRSQSRGKKFDLVMHFFVLEHVRDPAQFLKDGLDLLTPEGVLVFEVPSRDDPLVSIYNIPAFHKFYWSVAHNYYFNRNSLEYLLKKIAKKFEILPEQRYDLSNHIMWALEGKPGGQGKYSSHFSPELQAAYLQSMMQTGHCDTLIGRIYKTT